MAWSVLDLSSITDDLIDILRNAVKPTSPVWKGNGGSIDFFGVTVSGAMPEAERDASGCLLSLYLLHVSQDPYFRNTPVDGPIPQLNRRHPLSLNLYYLLTSYANKHYNQEQQAMSIAMRCFHEQAIVHITSPQAEEYTVTMEVETADEMSRLWQALSTPLRLSVVYKVSIVFVTPSDQPLVPAAAPTGVGLAVAPKGVSSSVPARIFGAAVRASFTVPKGATAKHADAIPSSIVPGLVRPGDDLIVTGAGLDLAAYGKAYLSAPGGIEREVTAWRQGTASGSDLRLRFPATVGTPPAASPSPGNYLLTVGSDGPTVRSNAAAVAVAARIDGLIKPPKLDPDGGGFYTVHGAGFTAAVTEVFLNDVPLARVAGTPAAGEFQIDPTETSLVFKPPSGLPSGRYFLRVRVNQIDSPPSWYIEI